MHSTLKIFSVGERLKFSHSDALHNVNTRLMLSNSRNQAPTRASENSKPAILQNYTFKTVHYCTNPAGETERILKVMWSPLALCTVSTETVKSVGCVSRTCRNKHGWSALSEERECEKAHSPSGDCQGRWCCVAAGSSTEACRKFNSATY